MSDERREMHWSGRVVGRVLALPILAYRYAISPLLGPSCRHAPTCSEYALLALKAHGPWAGLWLTAARFSRCHPWGSHGFDPVPKVLRRGSALRPWAYGRWWWTDLDADRDGHPIGDAETTQ